MDTRNDYAKLGGSRPGAKGFAISEGMAIVAMQAAICKGGTL
jgi:hypothetical protein